MKTIFRTFNLGLFLAAIFALGAVATSAQDPCTDLTGQNALYDSFLEAYKVKTADGRKKWVELGKQYVEKYGNCTAVEAVVTNTKYFNEQIPKWAAIIRQMQADAAEGALIGRFNAGLKSNNWDEVYAAGKEILRLNPDKFRSVEIVLAAIGGEEAFKNNHKYNAEALRFIKLSVDDLNANKQFLAGKDVRYGLSEKDKATGKVVYNFEFLNKDDALAWLNLYAGYITAVGNKQKAEALPYLYRVSQITASEASKNSVVYELIGSYYFDQLNKLVDEIKALQAQQDKAGITEDELKALVQQIKDKVALSNGTSERAMDAYARAFTFAKDPTIKARMKKNVEDAYKLRFGNTTGLDAWIASAVAKPFVNPTTPVTPISDPEPVKTTTTTTSGTPSTTTPATTTPVVNNTTTTPAKAAPTATTPKKPKAAVKKKTVAKRS